MPRRYNVIPGQKNNRYYTIIREASDVITRVITPYVITCWRYNAWDNVVFLWPEASVCGYAQRSLLLKNVVVLVGNVSSSLGLRESGTIFYARKRNQEVDRDPHFLT